MMEPAADWTVQAKCRELGISDSTYDRDLLFPPARAGKEIAAAKRYCRDCPVTQQCLADGDTDLHSVRGGLTGDERRRMREGAPLQVCRSCGLPFVARPANPHECTGCIGRYDRPIGPEDYKDSIVAMHRQGCSGEEICAHFGFSRDEIRLAARRWEIPLMRRSVAECGTQAGSARHRRYGEPQCAQCLAGNAARMMQRRRGGRPQVAA